MESNVEALQYLKRVEMDSRYPGRENVSQMFHKITECFSNESMKAFLRNPWRIISRNPFENKLLEIQLETSKRKSGFFFEEFVISETFFL